MQNIETIDRVFNFFLGAFLLGWLGLIGAVPVITLVALAFK